MSIRAPLTASCWLSGSLACFITQWNKHIAFYRWLKNTFGFSALNSTSQTSLFPGEVKPKCKVNISPVKKICCSADLKANEDEKEDDDAPDLIPRFRSDAMMKKEKKWFELFFPLNCLLTIRRYIMFSKREKTVRVGGKINTVCSSCH